MTKIKEDETVNLSAIISFFKELFAFLMSKKKQIIIIGLIGGALGFATSFLIKPKYTATLSFAIQEDEKAGGLSSIASQFGISLGGSSGGAFGGDNIYELLLSRNLVEKALLVPTKYRTETTNLITVYLNSYGINKNWKDSKKVEIRDLKFPLNQSRSAFSRAQDSVMQLVYKRILKEQLTAEKRSKKLSIGDITFISENEDLSYLFIENLIRETSRFYIDTKTKVSRTNLNILQQQTDSVKREYEKALYARASLVDNNLNMVRQSASVGLMKKQTDLQILTGAYIEMTKNLEILKLDLSRETPLIEVVDHAIKPLKVKRLGRFMGIGFGGLIAGFLALLFFGGQFSYKTLRERL